MDELRRALEAPGLDPDPRRRDWDRPEVSALVALVEAAFAAGAADGELVAAAAAVLFAAGERARARDWLERAAMLAADEAHQRLFTAGAGDLLAFTLLARAGWLARHDRARDARQVAGEAARAATTREVRQAARMLTRSADEPA